MTVTALHRSSRMFVPAVVAASVVAAASCGGPPESAAPTTRVVTDMAGNEVTVPTEVRRVGEQFPAHTVITIMLGAGSKISAITTNVKTIPFLQKVYPEISSIPELFPYDGTAGNVEELLRLDIDAVFSYNDSYQNSGVANLDVSFFSYTELADAVTLAGNVLGGTAPERAKKYVDYLNKNVELVRSRVANLPESERPSVVHIPDFPPLTIDGGQSQQGGLWVDAAGGRPEFSDQEGTYITTSAEELLNRDPDVLVIQAPRDEGSGRSVVAAMAEQIPVWNELSAVKNDRVYLNPRGMYPWERSTPEQALQVLWAAKTLHPDLFQDVDIREETRHFYDEFFGYRVTDAELDEIFQLTP